MSDYKEDQLFDRFIDGIVEDIVEKTTQNTTKVEWGLGPDGGHRIVKGSIILWYKDALPDDVGPIIQKRCQTSEKALVLAGCTEVIIRGTRLCVLFRS